MLFKGVLEGEKMLLVGWGGFILLGNRVGGRF